MPTVNQLARLFRRIAAGDQAGATEIALEIASSEEESGHHAAAQALRGSINPNGHRNGQTFSTPIPTNLLIHENEGPPLSEVVLKRDTRRVLEDVALEWRGRDLLSEAGISRRASLLFFGPPGCGKTLTARALGRELGLPVVTARLSSIVGAYLGQTGASLRTLFMYAQTVPCILLLDEIDAIGRARGRGGDVGEVDRVVISLLQELDHGLPQGLVIAATNLEKSIDEALWRRFAASLRFPHPTQKDLRSFARRQLKSHNLPATQAALDRLSRLKTFADVDSAVEDERRARVLAQMRDRI